MDPREAEREERHARHLYCAAMGISETVVRECWCTLEELFTGAVRRQGLTTVHFSAQPEPFLSQKHTIDTPF
jgi:hypothetical protein